ncbi:lipocalin family protein [Vibrio sp. JC009]|uniref:lipocalin family protein n=1 Tax=Vibrio sp. JC009 TaxID=2912314 RepID=UPI0023AEF8B5|nr:lipocalin family protein [Vibrio sp. JC009]WED23162.1 lipocalin family protein [Vibrio sp. JC009]
MRWLVLLMACISLQVASSELRNKGDLTSFDYPFILGNWYLVNPYPNVEDQDFLTIRLAIISNYTFFIEIQKTDLSIEQWEGLYSASNNTLILGLDSDTPQEYDYMVNHNQLVLNGITFMKGLPENLVGSWSSEAIMGDDILASDVAHMALTLQPDFLFSFTVESSSGEHVVHEGIFYYEHDHLVLMYENGEQDSRYSVQNDKLTLQSDNFDMLAVLNRVK